MVKTHGKVGEVVAVSAYGLLGFLGEKTKVCVVPPALKGSRWHEIEAISGDEHGWLVKLSGIDDLDAASQLVGKTLLVPIDQLPEGFHLHDVERLLGREVQDRFGHRLGTIQEILQGPVQDVWQIQGDFGQIMVPVVDEFVISVPKDDTQPCVVELPAGTSEAYDRMMEESHS